MKYWVCRGFCVVLCMCMALLPVSAQEYVEEYGAVYVVGNSDNYPIEAKINGQWVGMMPEIYSKISQQTGLSITYIDVGVGERESFVANEQAELVGATTGEEITYFATYYGLTTSPPVFSYEGETYYIGYTTLASPEIQDLINQSLEGLSDFDRIDSALSVAAGATSEQIASSAITAAMWVMGITILTLVITCVVVFRRYNNRQSEYSDNTVVSSIKNSEYFESELQKIFEQKIHHLYYIVLFEFDLSAVKWLRSAEDVDKCIAIARRVLESKIGSQCVVARESENGLIATIHANSEQDASTLINEIISNLTINLKYGFSTVNIPIVAGSCISSYFEDSFDDILRILRYACDTARDRFENHIICDKALIKQLSERTSLSRQLVEQSDLSDFVIHLLPTINTLTNEVTGAGALVRWDHRERGLLQPHTFLDFFETSGKIMELNYWVFESLCNWVSKQPGGVINSKCITAKMSSSNLRDPKFKSIIVYSMTTHKVPRDVLGIEINSDIIMENNTVVAENLKFLEQVGVSLVIDHFGAQNTCMSVFAHYPIKRLKLDPVFLADLSSKENLAIMRGLIQIGHELGMQIVCDMVQTPEQVEFLTQLGVDHLSGYKFYRPMPSNEFAGLITDKTLKV